VIAAEPLAGTALTAPRVPGPGRPCARRGPPPPRRTPVRVTGRAPGEVPPRAR